MMFIVLLTFVFTEVSCLVQILPRPFCLAVKPYWRGEETDSQQAVIFIHRQRLMSGKDAENAKFLTQQTARLQAAQL